MLEIYGDFILQMVIIFCGASLLGSVFVWLRQPIILAYIVLGLIVGPDGFKLIDDPNLINGISHMGIIFLMFLLGLHLHPKKLWELLQQTAKVTLITVLVTIALIATVLILFFNVSYYESLIIGVALSFSSTVIGLKLIPTTTLHHKKAGELMISILLFEDILAILAILFIYNPNEFISLHTLLLPIKTVGFVVGSWIAVRYVVLPLFRKFDSISEYVFLMSIGWCLGGAHVSHYIGLSHEIGAFFAGVSIATSPIALYIAEDLKSLREFFLVLFFFSIGAQFDILQSGSLIIPILVMTLIVLILKPIVFSVLLVKYGGSTPKKSFEMGLRLGQSSEFSLLIGVGALAAGKLSQTSAMIIETTAILTFILSTYIVVFSLPNPISPASRKRLN